MDLAGSEKISLHDPVNWKKRDISAGHLSQTPTSFSSNYGSVLKDRVNESKHINKSLFFLT